MLGQSQEDQFEAVVKAFQKMPAGAQKSALAVKFFGKQGMQLLPLLNSSATSIDELRQKASELGLIMSDDAVDASVEYTDALDTMQRTFDSLKYKVGAKLLPTFTSAMEKVSGYAGKLGKAFEENGLTGVFDTLKTDLRGFAQELKDSDNPVLQTLGGALDGVLNTTETIVKLFTDFDGTVAELEQSDNPVLQVLGKSLKELRKVFNVVVSLFTNFDSTVAELEQSDNPVLQALGKSLKELRKVFNVIVSLFTNFDATVAELQQSDNPVLTILAEAIVTVRDGIQAIVDLINGDWQSAMQTLRDSDSGILNTVGTVVDTFAQAEDRIRGAIDAAKEFFGISGSSGKLYETFAGKMGLSYKDIQDQSGLDAWINELSEGLKDAGFDSGLSKSLTDYIKGLDYSDKNVQNQVAQMLRDLSDPKQVDKGSLIKTWLAAQQINEEHKEEMQAVVKDLEVPEDQKEKIRKETQEALEKDPFKIRLMIEAGQFDPSKVAPQGSMWGTSSPEGSNAKGMWSVPYDDYVSKLHRGEMVLSASQARDYKDNSSGGIDISGIKDAIVAAIKDAMEGITVDSYLDGALVTESVSRRLATQLADRRYV